MTQRKLSLLVSCFCIALFAHAGNSKSASDGKDFKTIPARVDFGSYDVTDGSSAEVMAAFLQKQSPNLQSKAAGVQLNHSSTSLASYHYTFLQTYNGTPVYASGITVNVSKKNVVTSQFDDSYDMSKWTVNTTAFDYHHLSSYQEYLKQYFSGSVTEDSKQMIAFDEKSNTPEFCYVVSILDKAKHQREVLVGRDRIIFERDKNMYHSAPDSTVTGMIFNPDPLTTAHQAWGGPSTPWDNHNDSDVTQLSAQRQQIHFKADFDPGTGIFSLNSPYVQLQNFTGSGTLPVTSTTPDFSFTRAHSGFEDVMVFYHINKERARLHDWGFHFGDTPVICDPHGTNADNSWFVQPQNGSIYGTLTFGTGGVPDAQDADVIVHEYTHFLSYYANGTNGNNSERSSLDEGICDYHAASYSRNIDAFNWGWVYNFDGHNEFWDGRCVNDFTIYPARPSSFNVTAPYQYCETWSSALMSIWSDLGRNVTDSLAFESLYSYGSSTTLPQAAHLVIQADSMLYNGAHYCTLVYDFYQHGLAYDIVNCKVHPQGVEQVSDQLSDLRLLSNEQSFRVIVPQADVNLNIDLYDMAGKRLASYPDNVSEIKPNLPNGVYVIDVSTHGSHKAFKWVMVR